MGGTAMVGLTTGSGFPAIAGLLPESVIATLKVEAGLIQGNGVISLTDYNSAAGFELSDGTNLDPIIFSAAHNSFPLYITVVPEPGTLGLFAVAAAMMLGFHILRRRRA